MANLIRPLTCWSSEDEEGGRVRLSTSLGCSQVPIVVQHKVQHTGDVSHLCSKEKTLGVECLYVCTSEDKWRGCVFTTLPIGGFIYSITHPCPFTQKWWVKASTISRFYTCLICDTIYRRRKAFRVMVHDTPTTVHIVTTVYSKYTIVTLAVMS